MGNLNTATMLSLETIEAQAIIAWQERQMNLKDKIIKRLEAAVKILKEQNAELADANFLLEMQATVLLPLELEDFIAEQGGSVQ